MPTSRFDRFLPIAGVLAGIAFLVMAALTIGMPSVGDDDKTAYADWIGDHETRVMVAGFAAGYFCVAMLLFATGIRARLRSGEPGESTYSTAALTGGVTVAIAVSLMGWVGLAQAEAADQGRDDVVGTLGFLADFGWIPWVAGSAVLLLATGLGGLRTATLPRWLGVVTVALGVLCLLGPTGIVVYFATPFWLIVTGVVLARARRDAPTARTATRDASYAGV